MTIPPVTLMPAPTAGVWRLGLSHDPVRYNQVEPETFDGSSAGRFSLFSYGVLYCASSPAGCYAEALAAFRIEPRIRGLMGDAGQDKPDLMAMADIASSWREKRILVRLIAASHAQFLDVDTEQTRSWLDRDLKDALQAFGVEGPLTARHIHGKDRRVARQIAAWAVAQRNAAGYQLIQGITYRSSYSGQRCWAILRDTPLEEKERRPIRVEDVSLQAVAREYGLTVR